MFRNVYYDKRKSKIHLWETIKGERLYSVIDWVPYVFIPTVKETGIKSIYGENVQKKEFSAYYDYQNFCQKTKKIYENMVKPEIQFLCERYSGISDDDLTAPPLRIHFFDIEVHSSAGFPKPELAEHPIVLISAHDSFNNEVVSFGLKPYSGEYKKEPWFTYYHCKSEKDLIQRYLNYVSETQPDIITGWNIDNFDMPYMFNRPVKLWGEDGAKELLKSYSPIRAVSSWMREDKQNIDIGGVTLLDYFPLYKKYTKNLLSINLESYSLDFVAKFELEKGKLDYSQYKDLKTLYEKDHNLYVDYNVVDVKRVKQIHEKRNFIQLVQALSLLSKCPMKYYEAVTSLIEGAFLTYYRRNNLCAPYFGGGIKEPYEAAYVKDPDLGFHKYIVDLDIASSYPHAMITMNMGNETYFGKIMNFLDSSVASEENIINCVRKREFPSFTLEKADGSITKIEDDKLESFNKALKKGLFTIAPNGATFWTNKKGSIAEVERYVFDKRKHTKKLMTQAYKKAEALEKESKDSKEAKLAREEAERIKAAQIGYKLLINSIYGAISVPFYRGFNVNIAEAITACGRHSVKQGEIFVNEVMNDVSRSEELTRILEELHNKNKSEIKLKNIQAVDFIIYIDTDSLFLNIGKFISNQKLDDFWYSLSENERVKYCVSIAKCVEKYVNDNVYEKTQLIDYNSQEHDYKIKFKSEMVASSGLWIAKKKYCLNIIDNEGVRPSDPLKVTGLEVVRSDTPIMAKEYLKEVMRKILNGVDDDFFGYVNELKGKLKSVAPEEIANNISCNNTTKYIKSDGSTLKGTPRNIKGVAAYNRILKELKIEDKYEPLHEGEKGRVVYIKPNPWDIESLTFIRWIPEFEKAGIQIDYSKMIEKNFIDKIRMLLKPIGLDWKLDVDDRALNAFF